MATPPGTSSPSRKKSGRGVGTGSSLATIVASSIQAPETGTPRSLDPGSFDPTGVWRGATRKVEKVNAAKHHFEQEVVLHCKFVIFNILSINNECQDFMCDVLVDTRAFGQADLIKAPPACVHGDPGDPARRMLGGEYYRAHGQVYDPEFQIMNIKDAEKVFEHTHVDGDDACFKVRWRGTFSEELELEEFPFDQQDFHVKLMAGSHTRTKLRPMYELRPAACSLFQHHNFAMANVWQVMDNHNPQPLHEADMCALLVVNSELKSSNTSNSGQGRSYPIITGSARMRRRPWAFVWNVAIPMAIMSSMSYFSSGIDCSDLTSRLAITQTLMLTAVAYKFIASAGLPQLSYLTLLDKYVMGCFLYLVLMAFENFTVSTFNREKGEEGDKDAKTLDQYLMWGWAATWGAYNILAVIVACRVFNKNRHPVSAIENPEAWKESQHEFAANSSNNSAFSAFHSTLGAAHSNSALQQTHLQRALGGTNPSTTAESSRRYKPIPVGEQRV